MCLQLQDKWTFNFWPQTMHYEAARMLTELFVKKGKNSMWEIYFQHIKQLKVIAFYTLYSINSVFKRPGVE